LGRNEAKVFRRSRKIKTNNMAKSKKTKKETVLTIDTNRDGSLTKQSEPIVLTQKKYEECEWCFQFDEDEPQIFAWTDDEMNKNEDPKVIFTITNVENSYITFQNGKTGKLFKIFARELTNEGREMREKQREAIKNLQNGSENKETQS
jgi:hypothetical protein